ncbi:two-component system activity regulator YycH [Thermoflavimicrobium dichotomicum]|uniref:Two-component signal transduction system YycFG, regulatory protein YycH n=1 Tax=Thermoflavimicrobium dichotomicum TaxID=46223 RepID=A0A1I3K9X6_9BACL|nr:two-component system activity regulator YycH [Thermoflavimicrobium dichotomicum]SFI69267.1 Two-component signal transduction system YycFG, regulatory protein YycH [Thermoflavimicrobium dichotomicum]
MKEKWIENAKTVSLVILVVLSFVLTGSLWYMTPAYEEKKDIYRPLHYIGDIKYNQKQVYQLTSPPFLLLHEAGNHYWVTAKDNSYNEWLKTLSEIKIRHYEKKKPNANDWKYLFQQATGIELFFFHDLPIDTISAFIHIDEPDLSFLKDLTKVSRIWLYSDPQTKQINIWFISDFRGEIVQATTDLSIFQFEKQFNLSEKTDLVTFEAIPANNKPPWDPANNNIPFSRIIYLPNQPINAKKYTYHLQEININDMKQFLFSVDNITPTELSNGELVYAYDGRTLTYNKQDNYMVYIGPMPENPDKEKSLVTDIIQINKFMSDHRGWTGNYLLEKVQRQGSANRYTFRLVHQDYPVFWATENHLSKQYLDTIQFQVEKQEKRYLRYMYTLPEKPTNVVERSLPDKKSLLSILTERKIPLDKVERIFPGYRASKKEKQVVLEPVWVVMTVDGKQHLIALP